MPRSPTCQEGRRKRRRRRRRSAEFTLLNKPEEVHSKQLVMNEVERERREMKWRRDYYDLPDWGGSCSPRGRGRKR